jgi:hypothetical protein
MKPPDVRVEEITLKNSKQLNFIEEKQCTKHTTRLLLLVSRGDHFSDIMEDSMWGIGSKSKLGTCPRLKSTSLVGPLSAYISVGNSGL